MKVWNHAIDLIDQASDLKDLRKIKRNFDTVRRGCCALRQATMAAVQIKELVRLCDTLCENDDDRLSLLHDALAVIRGRLNIATAKAEGGTLGEQWIARHFDLKWQAEKRTGADAIDAEGCECEIKASLHPLKTNLKTHKTNICYKTPARLENESDDAFVERAEDHIRASTGGHYWGTWVEKTPLGGGDRIVLGWWVPSTPLAQLIGKKMHASSHMQRKSNTIAINFGAKVCLKCGGIHRIDAIVRALGGWNGRTDSRKALQAKARTEHAKLSVDVLDRLDGGACPSQCT